MAPFRFARLSLIVAALFAPALFTSAHAQSASGSASASAPAETVRPEMAKLLDGKKLAELVDQKKFDEVKSILAQAEAMPNRTPYEDFILTRIRYVVSSMTNDDMATVAALEKLIASGRLTPKDQDNYLAAVGNYYYNAKNYPKAIEAYKRYQKQGQNPNTVRVPLARSEYFAGDYAAAKADLQAVIADDEKAGKQSSLDDLKFLASASIKQKDSEGYVKAMEKIVAAYPNDDYWYDLINRGVRSKKDYDARLDLDTLRLQLATMSKMEADDYTAFAEMALRDEFPTEAKKALDAGYAAGVLGSGPSAAKAKALRDKANKGAAEDAKVTASGEANAAKSKTGIPYINAGWAYVTMDQFDKGIALLQKGIEKGGLKHPEEARLKLAMAYAKAGKKDEAIKAFQNVGGANGTAELAKYWTLYLNRPAQAAAAPAK